MRLLVVFGTRPECIKLAPVLRRAQFCGVEALTCTTGQHREMLSQCLDVFDIRPDFDLSVMRPNQNLAAVTARILDGISPVLEEIRPDAVMVQGDTTTAFAATLAAFYSRIPVAHVEAGLRTYDLNAPFPEEAMRQMVSRLAAWHFAPTQQNREALLAERIDPTKIFVTGNTVIDALFMVRDLVARGTRPDLLQLPKELAAHIEEPAQRRMVLITGHRRESFGDRIQDICAAIARLAIEFPEIIFVYPVHLNPNVLDPVQRALAGIANVHLLRPVNYYTFVYLMHRATLIISDSGGVQEEAPSLKVPVLVTRTVTERMEVVESGNVKLVGSDYARIIAEARMLLTNEMERLKMTAAENPYGDGHAADRILQMIEAGVMVAR